MSRSASHTLPRLLLAAVLVVMGWYFFDHAESLAESLFGCSYRMAPDQSGRPGPCVGASLAEQRTVEAAGAALVLGGIVVIAGLVDYGSKN
jgi:ammonia channel protein AmtB